MKIAIIEDELAIAQMYKIKLDKDGYDVRLALNGDDGLKLCEDFKPDIILLDIKMPNMTGDEMLMKVRSQDWGAEMKVIVLTNISKDEAPSNLRFLNVSRYIVKAHHTPTQVADLVKEILAK